jgi:glycosyltransferase involved in cell wall biosynthesis
MRVVHLADEPYDSGLTQYALRAAAGMARRGHAVAFWGLAGAPGVEAARREGLETLGIRHAWLELPSLRRALAAFRADVLVAHTGSSHTLGAALCARGGPALVRVRGDARPLRRRPGARLLWGRTRALLCANEAIRAEFAALFPDLPVPASVVYEGLEDPGPAAPPPGGSPVFGIVARLDPVKGHAALLDAFARASRSLPDARLSVVGRAENVNSRELVERAARLGVGDRVTFEGHVPDPADYMRRCHVGVVASLGSEAVSRAAVEWMAAGRPLVATRVGCLPEYVDDGRTGRLVPPGDAEALAAALVELGGDLLTRERWGAAARARYEDVFSSERFLDGTERALGLALHGVSPR